MNKTITTGWEVVKHSPGDKNIDPKKFNSFIYDVELELFRTTFDLDVYELMIDDVQDFSSLREYTSSETYVIGDRIIYRFQVFQSLVNDNQGVLPNDSGNWSLVNKFTKEAYQHLYDKHLASYLASEILLVGIKWGYIQLKSSGLVKRNDSRSNTNSVAREEASDMRREIREQINSKFENMRSWVSRNYEKAAYIDGDVKLLEPFYNSICNANESRTSRKFFFNI